MPSKRSDAFQVVYYGYLESAFPEKLNIYFSTDPETVQLISRISPGFQTEYFVGDKIVKLLFVSFDGGSAINPESEGK